MRRAGKPEQYPLRGHDALIDQFTARADARSLAHGYVFFGQRGVGKYSFAMCLARYLEEGEFAAQGIRPLGDALGIQKGTGERSIGIDAARRVRHFLSERPNRSAYRTLVLDNAELLTAEAENALLKITEEPYPSSLIILVATDPEELLPTLRSRVHAVYFAPLSGAELADWLQETESLPKKDAAALAKRAFGRPGLAWNMLHDERYAALLASAEQFLAAQTPAAANAIIKTLTDAAASADEPFDLDAFLEAVMVSARGAISAPRFWHAALRLREEARRFGLNAKLQLTALHAAVQS